MIYDTQFKNIGNKHRIELFIIYTVSVDIYTDNKLCQQKKNIATNPLFDI